MKRTLALAVLLASGFALNAAAQTPAPAAAPVVAIPAKVAVIAFQVAVAQTNEGQRNFADVQKKFEPKRAQLKVLNDEVDTLKKQLQAQGDKLSPAESASRTKTIDDKSKQLRIPIDRAMAIMVKKGLPHRDATVQKVDNDPLPYPARSLPYMATP